LRTAGRAGSAKEIRRESPPTEDSRDREGEGAEGRCFGMGVRRPVLITGGGRLSRSSSLCDLVLRGARGRPPLRPDLGKCEYW